MAQSTPLQERAVQGIAAIEQRIIEEAERNDIRGLRLEWNEAMGSSVDLAAYVRNLTEKKYKALGASGYDTLGFISYIPGNPRTYGGTMTVHF